MIYQKSNGMRKENTRSQLAFTLIELLITVAIIGILASIAYPSYTDFVLRSNRTEGQRELMRLANLQEQVFVDTKTYAADMKGLGENKETIDTESGHYTISISEQSTTTFILKAAAIGSQIHDINCLTLTINELGQKNLNEQPHCWEK